MPAAQYWRINQCETYAGNDLVLSELALYAGETRIDGTATVSSTLAPIAGVLANLADGNFATTATFAAHDVRLPGFAITFDFGESPQDVTAIGFAGPTQAAFLHKFWLSYSTNRTTWIAAFEGQRRTQWPGAAALTRIDFASVGDANYADMALLLHCDGANDSTTFTDSSAAEKTVAISGSVAISTTQSKFGGESALFSGGYLEAPSSADFGFGSGDYTLEAEVYVPSAADYMAVFDNRGGGQGVAAYVGSSGRAVTIVNNTSILLETGTAPLNQWWHLAVVRLSSIITAYVDGIAVGSVPDARTLAASAAMRIGNNTLANQPFIGYMDEIRITKGKARYTENFTPPASKHQNSAGATYTPDATPVRALPPMAAVQLSGGMAGNAGPTLSPTATALDLQDAGPYRITGSVKKKATPNAPLRRRVQLYNQRDNRLIRETWSDATTGVYTFNNIKGGPGVLYFVCAFDHTNTDKSVIADQLAPEPMP